MSLLNKIGNKTKTPPQTPQQKVSLELNKKFNIETENPKKTKGTPLQRVRNTISNIATTVKSLFNRQAKLPPQPPRNPPPIPTENTEGSRKKTASQNIAKEIAAKSKKDKTSTNAEATTNTKKPTKPTSEQPAPAKKAPRKKPTPKDE